MHLPSCRSDQSASDADSSRKPRQIFKISRIEPPRILDFRPIYANFAAVIIGEERNHERMRERPSLAGEATRLAHADPDFLIHLALQTLLQRFARLHKPRPLAVHPLWSPRCTSRKERLTAPHQPLRRRRD